MEVAEVLSALETRLSGLSEEGVVERLKLFGRNSIRKEARFVKLGIVLNQLKSPLILTLIFAGAVTFFLKEWVDTAVIFATIFINTAFGFYQENKAESVLSRLKSYIRTAARVRRGDKEKEIDAEELAPGDIVRISQGDHVPADCRLIAANNFEVDESILTGESLPQIKKTNTVGVSALLTDRTSMIFGGTSAVRGFAEAVVTATGDETEFGKIADLVRKKERHPTPLQKEITSFSYKTGLILAVLIGLFFLIGLRSGQRLFDMFLISVAVAVSSVPEGLPIALTAILAIGVERLARRKGVVRKLLAAESLGSVSVILTDKTGTLTQAKMELAEIVPWGKRGKRELLEGVMLGIEVLIENPGDNFDNWKMVGSPIEVAFVKGAAREGVLYPDVIRKFEVADRLPFSSEYKFSATVSFFDSRARLNVLGAPDILLDFTNLSAADKKNIMAEVEKIASRGERVLAAAFRDVKSRDHKISHLRVFDSLEFGGLLSFRDPLRPQVKNAIRQIADSGIKTVIVTGDHLRTAETVARELGIFGPGHLALSGEDIKHLSHEELLNQTDTVRVWARVTPEDKFNLVKAYKERGEIVAVTGDGVNDAPALKEADIGVALGSGSDVAKESADLVLLDDNFETLVLAINEGRRIIQNIRKVLVYLLTDVLDELFLIGGALIVGLPLPLNALQILYINLFSDSFPALAFAFEDGVDDPVYSKKDNRGVFNYETKFLILTVGVLTSFLLFALYWLLLKLGFEEKLVRSFIFASLAIYTPLLAFSLRSFRKPLISYNPFSNFSLTGGVIIGVILTFLALYLPFLQRVLGTVALPILWVGGVFAVSLFNILLTELSKWFFRKVLK